MNLERIAILAATGRARQSVSARSRTAPTPFPSTTPRVEAARTPAAPDRGICGALTADCDGNGSGETDLRIDRADCGSCGNACGTEVPCANAKCASTIFAGGAVDGAYDKPLAADAPRVKVSR